jgi:thioredoxin reductase
MHHSTDFEVVIIGGSYAGLSAAMALGRSLRKVLIIDNGKPCNAQTPYSHNFITHDGKPPHVIRTEALKQVLHYPTVQIFEGTVERVEKNAEAFSVFTNEGRTFSGAKLLLATGLKDQFPAIEGFEQCWGISVLHCPYCHGYEVKDLRIGLLANGDGAWHLGKLVSNLTRDLTIYTNGKVSIKEEQLQKFGEHNIKIVDKTIASLQHNNGKINQIVFEDGSHATLSALFAHVPFTQHGNIAQMLGCELTENGLIKTDELQHTSIAGVYAAGDNCTMGRAVSTAIASGTRAGASINRDLVDDRF